MKIYLTVNSTTGAMNVFGKGKASEVVSEAVVACVREELENNSSQQVLGLMLVANAKCKDGLSIRKISTLGKEDDYIVTFEVKGEESLIQELINETVVEISRLMNNLEEAPYGSFSKDQHEAEKAVTDHEEEDCEEEDHEEEDHEEEDYEEEIDEDEIDEDEESELLYVSSRNTINDFIGNLSINIENGFKEISSPDEVNLNGVRYIKEDQEDENSSVIDLMSIHLDPKDTKFEICILRHKDMFIGSLSRMRAGEIETHPPFVIIKEHFNVKINKWLNYSILTTKTGNKISVQLVRN